MDEIAIYSNSWGESDDTDFGGPDQIVEEALLQGIHNVSFCIFVDGFWNVLIVFTGVFRHTFHVFGCMNSEKLYWLRKFIQGRSSKGSIYVWASGNSGPHDNCNADGYVTSIYTIAIASVSRGGYVASYGETCSAILAATYASGRTSIVVHVFLFCSFPFKKCILYNICIFQTIT